MSFDKLGLLPSLLSAVKAQGYETPTPVQAQSIPKIIEGKDVLASAQTGTGKTAGFTLPMLHRLMDNHQHTTRKNNVRALILTPTRELAAQVAESVTTYGKHLPLTSAVIFGGVNITPQIHKLRKGVDILIATPGRLLDHVGQGHLDLSKVEILVLDEADRMLDMGFIHDIKKVLAELPRKKQTLFFSATFSRDIKKLADELLHLPVHIEVSPENTAAERITQIVYKVDRVRKVELLAKLILEGNWKQVLVFGRTKHGCNKLVQKLDQAGITAMAIHGNKSQAARIRALANFKQGKIQVLVGTDVAARGLDIDHLPHVVNFELPNVPEDYVHRIGRTGRAGNEGEAISLVCIDELKLLSDIEQLLGMKINSEILPGFELDPKATPKPIQNGRGGGGMRNSRGGGRPRSSSSNRPSSPRGPRSRAKFSHSETSARGRSPRKRSTSVEKGYEGRSGSNRFTRADSARISAKRPSKGRRPSTSSSPRSDWI